jgi:hypothetical protein
MDGEQRNPMVIAALVNWDRDVRGRRPVEPEPDAAESPGDGADRQRFQKNLSGRLAAVLRRRARTSAF